MERKKIIEKLAELVHQAVLSELNTDEQFKYDALRSYFERLELEEFDISQFKLIPKSSNNSEGVRIEDCEFEVSNYAFAIQTFNYVDKPKNQDIGLIPQVSIETRVIKGSFSIDDNDVINVQIHNKKLIAQYTVSDRIELKI